MNIETKKVAELCPAPYNPRKDLKPGDPEFEKLKRSIETFGYVEPVIWNSRTGNVVGGHQRLKVMQALGHEAVECVVVDLDESDEKALNVALNKIAGEWDIPKLDDLICELQAEDYDVTLTGFDFSAEASKSFFDMTKEERDAQKEGSDEYDEFLKKFEDPKTTDDCYTPVNIYETVADYVAERYDLSKDNFVRPFYPGGDYQREKYKPTDVVVDNPPFSILAEILRFYAEHGVRFFLFAPGMTIFSGAVPDDKLGICAICENVGITYENNATVGTSFVTNLEGPGIIAKSDPDLYKRVEAENDKNLKAMRRSLPKYSYPVNVCTAAMLSYLSKYGEVLKIARIECEVIEALDAQKNEGKAIYGKGLLISEKAAAEKAAATRWPLSEREKRIIEGLGHE